MKKMVINPWSFTPNYVLITLYRQIVERELDNELGPIILNEIKRRHLRIDKPTYLKKN
ncbi:hypothetical protein GCM10020331_010580 [Ectobacillus funiculus]